MALHYYVLSQNKAKHTPYFQSIVTDCGSVEAMPQATAVDETAQAVAHLNYFVQSVSRELSFAIAGSEPDVTVQIFNSHNGELIREISSNEAMHLASNLKLEVVQKRA